MRIKRWNRSLCCSVVNWLVQTSSKQPTNGRLLWILIVIVCSVYGFRFFILCETVVYTVYRVSTVPIHRQTGTRGHEARRTRTRDPIFASVQSGNFTARASQFTADLRDRACRHVIVRIIILYLYKYRYMCIICNMRYIYMCVCVYDCNTCVARRRRHSSMRNRWSERTTCQGNAFGA